VKLDFKYGLGRRIALHIFPIGYRSGYNAKERMRCGKRNFKMLVVNGSASQLQFSEKPSPFVLQLAIGNEDVLLGHDGPELGAIERITA